MQFSEFSHASFGSVSGDGVADFTRGSESYSWRETIASVEVLQDKRGRHRFRTFLSDSEEVLALAECLHLLGG